MTSKKHGTATSSSMEEDTSGFGDLSVVAAVPIATVPNFYKYY